MRGIRHYAIVAAAFMAGTFVASPELRAYAANTVGSLDIIDGQVKTVDLGNDAVTSAKIKNGEVKTDDIAPSAVGSLRIKDNDVKAQDIAPDAVGASEIIGVSKLIFAECSLTLNGSFPHGTIAPFGCNVQGAASGDNAIAVANANLCWGINRAEAFTNSVHLTFTNNCAGNATFGTIPVSIIVYNK